jgi:hypothetical protein
MIDPHSTAAAAAAAILRFRGCRTVRYRTLTFLLPDFIMNNLFWDDFLCNIWLCSSVYRVKRKTQTNVERTIHMKNMKKALFITISIFTVVFLAACASRKAAAGTADAQKAVDISAQSKTEEPADAAVDGGWEYNQGELSLDANPDAKAAFDKALDGLVGCAYEPVALIGSQVVAGTNYCILCRTTPVVPDAKSSFSLVTIYEDLNGNAEITDVTDLNM